MAHRRPVRVLVLLVAPVTMSAATVSVAAAPNPAASPLVLDAIDSCITRLNASVDIGYERIAARCPGLARRLEESGGSVWLPRDWRQPGNDLSAGGLRELRELLLASTAASRARGPSVAALPAALAFLTQQDAARDGWWGRTKAWLHELFERRQDEEEDGLSGLIGQSGVSEAVLELISYFGLALVVVLAVVIICNELRAGGVIGRLRRWFAKRATARPQTEARGPSTWDDVQKVSLAQRPRLLLELVVARLTAENRLPSPRGLTVHELARAARLPDETDRERLAELGRMAQRVRFSNEAIASEAIAAAVEDGRTLLERIAHYPRDLQAARARL